MEYLLFWLNKTLDSLKFDNRNLHKNIVITRKQLKMIYKVCFWDLEAGDIGYLSF